MTWAPAPAPARTVRSMSTPTSWTLDQLHAELARFERELVAARLKPTSIRTYVERVERFLRWLGGDYRPRGPQD